MSVTRTLTATLALVACSCSQQPAFVRIDVRGPAAAALFYDCAPHGGREPDCRTPCVIQIPSFGRQQVSLEQEGYYPACFDIEWSLAGQAHGTTSANDPAALIVPMRPRAADNHSP